MFKGFFIALSKAGWAQRAITKWKPAWRAASRFIAGENADQAIEAVKALNAAGLDASLDHLGENTTDAAAARAATAEILRLLEIIHNSDVRANVSIKLSQIGQTLDEDLCRTNLRLILETAACHSIFIRLDMEDSSLTDSTLEMYRWACAQGFSLLGVVIQSYLYRSTQDVASLQTGCTPVRLCKGAYKEPPSVAFPDKADVDDHYDRLVKQLFESAHACAHPLATPDGRVPPLPAIATHDPRRIVYARRLADEMNFPRQAFEFQMLYGIRRDLQQQLVQDGYRVRVYVPYGSHWYPYFMRRLAERPANLWFFMSNFFRS